MGIMHQPTTQTGLRSIQRIMYVQGDLPEDLPLRRDIVPYHVREGYIVAPSKYANMKPKPERVPAISMNAGLWYRRCKGEAPVTPSEAVAWFTDLTSGERIGLLCMHTPPLDEMMCETLLLFVQEQLRDNREIGIIPLYGDATPREAIPARMRRYVYPIAPRTEGLELADIGEPDHPLAPEALLAHWLDVCSTLDIDLDVSRHAEIEVLYAGLSLFEVNTIMSEIIVNEKGPGPYSPVSALDQLLDPAIVTEYRTLWDRAG